jgi:putative Mg2+ transporter-C (MgtC) family protein
MITEVELTIVLRAMLAALLGFVIGWERKVFGEPVRARAVALAAATAATLVALTESFYPDETARVVAGVVTGIGFLGAGAILRSSTGEVRGHTMAASLWAMSAIGMAVGAGHELLGILLAVVLYCIIAISEWPLLTRLKQYQPQKQAGAARSRPYQPPPESEASDDPPVAK